MKEFLQQLGERVLGVLSGFDRLLIRGVLRCVINPRGLNGYLFGARVPMAQFEGPVQPVSTQLIDASLRHAAEAGCEIRYLDNSQDGKQDLALEIARRDGRRNGPICVLKCVEPCVSFRLRRHRDTKKISRESCRRGKAWPTCTAARRSVRPRTTGSPQRRRRCWTTSRCR